MTNPKSGEYVDWLTFIVSETKALVWPAVVLTTVITLRQQISSLVAELGGGLKTAKGGGIELSFGARIDEVEKSLPTAELSQITAPSNIKRIEQITDLSALPPAYIISQAWLRVEEEVGRSVAIPASNSGAGPSLPSIRLLKFAAEQGLIRDDEFRLLNQLRKLRNQAAHSLDPVISLTDALRYDDIANSVVQEMKKRAEARRKGPDIS